MNTSGSFGARTKINQGDIIHRPSTDVGDRSEWGFIVTADCDIAQDKAGAKISYLEIVTVRDFLEHIWSREALRKIQADLTRDATALVSKAAREIDPSYDALTPTDLITWLSESSGSEVVAALELPPNKQLPYLEALDRVELAHGIRAEKTTALQRLYRIWTSQKASAKTIQSRLTQALDYNRATDFHLIPSIHGSTQLGFVVLLREVSAVAHNCILASALEHRIAGNPRFFYVAAPSSDNLRYAISQKMAFLFSRIGMSEDYEAQCDIVTQIAVEETLSALSKNGADI